MSDDNGPEPAARAGQPAPDTAGSNPHVGARGGFIAGDPSTYFVAPNQAPADKYQVAVRFLDAGVGARAAALIQEAVDAGFRGDDATPTNQVAYYWVLSILRGRAFQQLLANDFEAIEQAKRMADRQHNDDWLRAHDLMCQLVDFLRRQDEFGIRAEAAPELHLAPPSPGPDQLRAGYEALPPRFQEDFQRHLDFMLVGGIEDELQAAIAGQASQKRMSSRRLERAWKYFEQSPEQARRREIPSPVFSPAGRWIVAGLGALAGLAGTALAIDLLQLAGVVRAVVVAALLTLAATTAALCGIRYRAAAERHADRQREFGQHHVTRYSSRLPATETSGLPREAESDAEAEQARRSGARRARFTRAASRHLDEQFRANWPGAPAARRRWDRETAGFKQFLRNDILTRYAEPELAVGALNWLITWRVQEMARMWREDGLRSYRNQLRPRLRDAVGWRAGLIVTTLALTYGLVVIAIRRPAEAVTVLATLAVAATMVALSRLDVHLVMRRRWPDDQKDTNDRFEAEQAEHLRWRQVLSDRPGDNEMARWLDFDKLHLRQLAMTELGLTSRDILSHATLTEPAAGCVLVRMPHGPPRYSSYRVTVFLLTRDGVRQVATTLDFSVGSVHNQLRRSFRYDAIAAASIHETGVRYDTGRRQDASAPKSTASSGHGGSLTLVGQDAGQGGPSHAAILRQDVVLSLRTGGRISFRVENLDEFEGDAPDEDPVSVLDLALDASGIAAAIHVLEDISGHGANWVTERMRRRRGWLGPGQSQVQPGNSDDAA